MENKNEVNGTVNNEQQEVKQEKKAGFIKRAWNKTPKWAKWIGAGVITTAAIGIVKNAIKDQSEPEDFMDEVEEAMKDAGVEVVNF